MLPGMPSAQDRAGQIEQAWRRERPDLDPSAVGIVTRIWHLAKVFSDERRRLLAAEDIDPASMDLLGALRRSGPPYALTTRELARQTLVTPAAVSQRLTRAEQRGWVTREPGEHRAVLVRLTDSGQHRVDDIAGRIFQREAELLAGISSAQRSVLARELRRLLHSLDDDRAGQPLPGVGSQV